MSADATDPSALDARLRSDFVEPSAEAFRRVVTVMARLRAPDGCPWDREQTHASLARYLLEETYETLEAIDSGDLASLRDELGDVVLQVIFHANIAWEEGAFSIADVCDHLADKLVRRHPHVFGDVEVTGAAEVLENWERQKRDEKPAGVMDGIPAALPALARTAKLTARAAHSGFDHPTVGEAAAHARDELDELLTATDRPAVEEEVGDLLFAAANLARRLGIPPEDALRRANAKFEKRFASMEKGAKDAGRPLESLSREEWREYWDQAKTAER